MNGMIFAAGLGTRLRPLTNDLPKALVELKGKALLELVIERMREVQVERLVINSHHFADQSALRKLLPKYESPVCYRMEQKICCRRSENQQLHRLQPEQRLQV